MWPEPCARDLEEMAAEGATDERISGDTNDAGCYLETFQLFETQANFYMIGRSRNRNLFRVLKIDRSEPSQLNIYEDSTSYSEIECKELLNRIHLGNKSTGGLKFLTNCYGIVGFVKFLGPYYMLLITERREIGAIFGHKVYAVAKSEIISLPNSIVQSHIANSKNEHRYKKLFCTVDLTKDFFYSSYHIMQSLQKNICESRTGQMVYETMFIWNEFLTREVHSRLKSTSWTVDLVYGFFKQVRLPINGEDVWLTLIARRSRHFAGTRYLKRGVDENGSVANDVETEQIIFKDTSGVIPKCVSSVVQNRGSIPLFWSQETSKLNLKPDIILKKDKDYESTRLHFENLEKRYGSPIIILDLIKTEEKKPRESILRTEFASAIEFINKNLPVENNLKYIHWDLHKHSRSNGKNVLTLLGKVATCTLKLTGFFCCELTPTFMNDGELRWPNFVMDNSGDSLCNNHSSSSSSNNTTDTDDVDMLEDGYHEDNSDVSGFLSSKLEDHSRGNCLVKSLRFQKGVLRTNCIDCLDRTNVAQYAYGLAALGHQLHALNISRFASIHLDATIADDLMTYYERMGDTLSMQYGGSAAHNKIFSERRGQWKATTQSQEFFRTLQRYCNNAYLDAAKQAAIDLFLGHFQPHPDKPTIWEFNAIQHSAAGIHSRAFIDENSRLFIKRSLSDGNILHESRTPLSSYNFAQNDLSSSGSCGRMYSPHAKRLSESSLTPEISQGEINVSHNRYSPMTCHGQCFADNVSSYLYKDWDSNFLDLDSLLSSSNSVEGEKNDRSRLMDSPVESLPTKIISTGQTNEAAPHLTENGVIIEEDKLSKVQDDILRTSNTRRKFSDSFEQWVNNGETLCY